MSHPSISTPLLDTKAAAEYLTLNEKSLSNGRSQGRGPAYVKIGRLVRYRLADLDAFIERGIVELSS